MFIFHSNRLSAFVRLSTFALLSCLILVAYSNTFHSSWHFDDKPNIVNNYHLHLNDLQPESIVRTFFTNPRNPFHIGDKMYRPIPCLTFALNWYFGRDDVFGYHIVNIIIHIFTAFFLFLTILNLFKTPNLKDKFKENEHLIALLASILWAVNPVQTQAVTYIVQRMAQMAAMFYILGIYSYIKGRIGNSLLERSAWFVWCLFCFLFAVGSKENAVMLPMALVLVEITFFQDLSLQKTRRLFLWIAAGISVSVFLLGSLFFLRESPFSFLNGYAHRPFSLAERLLTEPIIVIYYLTQIFYPVPNRLSIEHDVIISSCFFKPWTTIPSILIIVSLIGFGLLQIRKRPLLSFTILFFFLNHIIESTIIPLELVFEHRNYLPSLFLFLPVSYGFNRMLVFYAKKNNFMSAVMVTFITLLVVCLCSSTFIRNRAWANKKTLWADAMIKAPKSARPMNVLAIDLAWGDNVTQDRYEIALALFEKSLALYKSRNSLEADIIGNMASIYYNNKHEYKKAVQLYKKALKIDPDYLKIRYDLIKPLILMEKWEEASKNADLLLSKSSVNENYYNIKGFILLWQKRHKEALLYFRKALALAPKKSSILLNIGVALSLMDEHKNAEWFLRRAAENSHKDIMVFFCLIENSLRAGNISDAEEYVDNLFASFDLKTIINKLEMLPRNYESAPVSKELISPTIKRILIKMSKDIQ